MTQTRAFARTTRSTSPPCCLSIWIVPRFFVSNIIFTSQRVKRDRSRQSSLLKLSHLCPIGYEQRAVDENAQISSKIDHIEMHQELSPVGEIALLYVTNCRHVRRHRTKDSTVTTRPLSMAHPCFRESSTNFIERTELGTRVQISDDGIVHRQCNDSRAGSLPCWTPGPRSHSPVPLR